MVTIQTTAHVGEDGMLRLEVPVEAKGQDVQVTLMIGPAGDNAEKDPLEDLRRKVAEDPELAARIKLPPPGRRPYVPFEPNDLPGPTASEILIRDRR